MSGTSVTSKCPFVLDWPEEREGGREGEGEREGGVKDNLNKPRLYTIYAK